MCTLCKSNTLVPPDDNFLGSFRCLLCHFRERCTNCRKIKKKHFYENLAERAAMFKNNSRLDLNPLHHHASSHFDGLLILGVLDYDRVHRLVVDIYNIGLMIGHVDTTPNIMPV